jgi:hypothetical protein
LAEGALVSAFGIAGLVSAALHPNAGPTGAPVLGLTTTAAHSGLLLAFGVAAIAAVGHRRAAVTVTAVSSVAYLMLLFISSVATARDNPTPLGLHAADILLHGVLGVVNLALLMWLIPDELGDEAWVRRRRRGRDRRQPSAPGAAAAPPTCAQESSPPESPAQRPLERPQTSEPTSTNPPVRNQSASRDYVEPSPAPNVESSTPAKPLAARVTGVVLSRRGLVVMAVLAAVVGIVVWLLHRTLFP